MINEIKQYKNLVEVEVTDFAGNMEIMYWEGEVSDFSDKYQTLKAILFPMHGNKVVDVNRIQSFMQAKPNIKTLHNKIASIDIEGQETIKLKVGKYKRDFGKYPTEQRIDNLIDSVLNPHKEILNDYENYYKSLAIQKEKHNKKVFFDGLDEKKQQEIINQARDYVFKENKDYKDNIHRLGARSLFLTYKNKIIDKYYAKQ